MPEKKYILNKAVAEKKMRRIAYEILENNAGVDSILIAGIGGCGIAVANTVAAILGEISSIKTEMITISMDKRNPGEITLSKQTDFNGKTVILVDDVANSGKTLLYALKPILEYHPEKIQIMVLVSRTHKKFPVQPDYVGIALATTLQEHIFVETEGGKVTGAYLV